MQSRPSPNHPAHGGAAASSYACPKSSFFPKHVRRAFSAAPVSRCAAARTATLIGVFEAGRDGLILAGGTARYRWRHSSVLVEDVSVSNELAERWCSRGEYVKPNGAETSYMWSSARGRLRIGQTRGALRKEGSVFLNFCFASNCNSLFSQRKRGLKKRAPSELS